MELAKGIKLTSQLRTIGDDYFITVTIPKDDYTGLKLEYGARIDLNIGFSVIMNPEGHQHYVTILEPNRFCDVDLES